MLQTHTSLRVDQVEYRLRMAVQIHGGDVLAISHVGRLLSDDARPRGDEATSVTVCFTEASAKLLRADIRFSAFLPSRVAIYGKGEGAILETASPRDWCRLIGRGDLEDTAAPLEELLRRAMEDAARRQAEPAGEHVPTEDLVNMRAALPQRLDCRGTKVEELAGTGVHDAAGG